MDLRQVLPAGVLLDGQSAYYQVVVPDTLNGQGVLGWKLDLAPFPGWKDVPSW